MRNGSIKEIFSVKQYVQEKYPSKEDRVALNNELLLSYGLYGEILEIEGSTISKLQLVKAKFRLGKYTEVIKICNELLSICVSNNIEKQTLYYLSSSLYYETKYNEAMDIAEQCCDLAIKSEDKVFHLNALINYASILYVYASLQSESEQEHLLEKAVNIYKIVLEKSKGINIESEANALWGLGDLERYRGNNERAGIYLQQALVILKNIGNNYAIKQLIAILKELE